MKSALRELAMTNVQLSRLEWLSPRVARRRPLGPMSGEIETGWGACSGGVGPMRFLYRSDAGGAPGRRRVTSKMPVRDRGMPERDMRPAESGSGMGKMRRAADMTAAGMRTGKVGSSAAVCPAASPAPVRYKPTAGG